VCFLSSFLVIWIFLCASLRYRVFIYFISGGLCHCGTVKLIHRGYYMHMHVRASSMHPVNDRHVTSRHHHPFLLVGRERVVTVAPLLFIMFEACHGFLPRLRLIVTFRIISTPEAGLVDMTATPSDFFVRIHIPPFCFHIYPE
jgi:hypothetical protein